MNQDSWFSILMISIMHCGVCQISRNNEFKNCFISQECVVAYTSATCNTDELVFNVPVPFVITELFEPGGEWELLNAPVGQKNVTFTSADREEFSQVAFMLVLRRIPNYFILFMITPLVSMLLLVNVAFILPVQSGEKMSFQMGILVMFSVFWMLTDEVTPRAGNSIPRLSKKLHSETVLLLWYVCAMHRLFLTDAVIDPDDVGSCWS